MSRNTGNPVHQTRLTFEHVRRVDKANKRFGGCKDGSSIILIHPGRSPIKPYITVPEGVYALVQKHGRDMDYVGKDGKRSAVWPAGFHSASLFTRVSHLVTKQHVVFDTPVKGCKTADDVTVHIDMSLVFRIMGDVEKGEDPELVRTFVYQLGPYGLETQLRNAQEEAVRALARDVYHTEVFSLRSGTLKGRVNTGDLSQRLPSEDPPMEEEEEKVSEIVVTNVQAADDYIKEDKAPEAKVLYYVTEDICKILNKQFNRYGVEITSVAITNVRLPETFENQMQEKTTYQSVIREQHMQQKSDMQLLRYREELEGKALEKEMERLAEIQNGKTHLTEIEREINVLEAETKKLLRQMEEKKLVELAKIETNAAFKLAEIDAEAKCITTKIHAECDAKLSQLRAEKQAIIQEMQSKISKIHADKDAKVKKLLSEAEGTAAPKLLHRRQHEIDMKKVELLSHLASNEDMVLSGNVSNNLLAEMLVTQRNGQILLAPSLTNANASNIQGSSTVQAHAA